MDKKSLDPFSMEDWQLAEAAEESMTAIEDLAAEFGVDHDELLPYGRYMAKVDYRGVLERLNSSGDGRYIDITAMTPTPLGEGKTTTCIGLVEGLGALGKKVSGAIRQPSGGPTFNIKGSAAGGGLSQCLPMSEFSLGMTGDIDAITNANNLAMVAVSSRLQHEFNYSDRVLEKKGLRRLDIDPNRVEMGWAIDFSAQALRDVIIGIGGKMDGFMMKSRFQISVSSELMAILAVANDLKDVRSRIGRITAAYDKKGKPVSTADLEVDGAMAALLIKAVNPTLIQTMEGQPVLVHAGPFANIAIGQSSVIADRLGLKLCDYHVTESGFGADIGFEKFWNLKCRASGKQPDAVVIVCTVRALKLHGGGPPVKPGAKLDPVYKQGNPGLVEKGLENLIAHIETVKKSGSSPVVCINHFADDTDEEIALIRKTAEAAGARAAVSRHWETGGEGARELAEAVIDACEEENNFRFLYEDGAGLKEKIDIIAREIYGAAGVEYSAEAAQKLKEAENESELAAFGPCMAKTQYSLSHDAALKGRPRGFVLPVRDLLFYRGAELIVPVAGDIKLMPGTASDPAFRRIDVDTETGRVYGLF